MTTATELGGAPTTNRQTIRQMGLQWSVDPDSAFGQSLLQQGFYEPKSTRLALAAARRGAVVLDVGAHAGWHAALMAMRVGPTGRVIAFEPLGRFREQLHANLAANGLLSRVTVVPVGLSDEDGRRTAAVSASSATLHWDEAAGAQSFAEIKVRRLDDVAVEFGLPRVQFVRLDADGHELRALRGMAHVLESDRPTLCVRMQSGDAPAIFALLRQLGYELADPTTGMPFAADADALAAVGPDIDEPCLLAAPVEQMAGMPVLVHDDAASLRRAFELVHEGSILESDIDEETNDCERHGRKRRDAEVLCAVAANANGPCLDLGTSHGRSAYKIATNLGPRHRVYTVNMLPEDAPTAGRHITHALTAEQIGSYCRERGIDNVVQVFADTARWTPDAEIDGLALAFVDACHDAEAVRRDSHLAWSRLRPGGFLLWHDFSPLLRLQHEWIRTSMQGVAQFLRDLGIQGPVHHLRGSWIGMIQKGGA